MRRALVVDDHPSFRRSARALLVEEGFEFVGEAENGADALELAEELIPDLILLDVQLPDIDGFEVASRLLALDHEWRIVLVSSRGASDYGSLIEASGAHGFVCKGELSGAMLQAYWDE